MTKAYEIHPYCAAFPDIEGEEFEALREDLKMHGQQEPCWTWGEWLIDGKNRERALKANRQQVKYQKWEPILSQEEDVENELRHFVLSKNLHRRHLNESQRAMVAAKLANGTHGGDRSQAANLPLAQKEAGKLLNVSERMVRDAGKVIAESPAEIVHAVEKGEVKASDAVKIAPLPKAEQKAALKAVESGEAPTLAKAAHVEPKLSTVLRNGKITASFDCEPILKSFGAVARSIDDAANKANLNNSPDHKRCIAKLSNAREEFVEFSKLIKNVGAKKAK